MQDTAGPDGDDNDKGKSATNNSAESEAKSDPAVSASASDHEAGTVRLIMYDFDQTITCLHLYRELHGGQCPALNKFSDSKLLDVFGGQSRLRQLQAHFQHLASHHIDVAIVSFGWTDVIKQALTRVNLYRFFKHPNEMIIGRDHKDMVKFNKSKAKIIESLMQKKNLKFDQALFVEDSLSNVQQCQSKSLCKTVHISNRDGMTLEQMHTIEKGIYVYSEQELLALKQSSSLSNSLSANHGNENGNGNGKTHKKNASSLAKYRITKVPDWFDKQFQKEATPVIEIEDESGTFPDTDAVTNKSNESEVKIASKFTFGDFA
eukprot:CAMPEP_0202694718 /NCGR_PEP_ID=MMETSP1385-20130828/8512_1 /ASSEMBLY_ACC=CAM_ASM_000861 /TAXON_ID=933848 /ORGANISM="Elphidium margaritaceum" /LENGTH=318 /DNA_ID=CAMNT_0049350617 /DNA_START=90 /DNA_END=1043 /DNA_ORIENTATION=+